MDENTNKAIFTLMQKVVDKLEAISEDVNNKDKTELGDIIKKSNIAITELVTEIIKTQSKFLQTSSVIRDEVINYIKENKITPNVNSYTEYSLLGSKSHFKPKALILMLFSLVIIWSSLKYIPTYFIKNGSLSKEKEEYKLFYNYVYLKQFKNDEPNIAGEILKRVKQKDTLLMKEYHILLNTYQREIRKQELKEELNSLDNNDS
jgi:predicted DNA-binding ribbon-helix-helix protein